MKRMLGIIFGICRFLYGVSGVTLLFMMCLAVTDVVLRMFDRPIMGAYEIVSFSLPVVISFGLPYTSWRRGHVHMEFLITKMPKRVRDYTNICSRLVGIALFGMLGYNLFIVGNDLRNTGEVSATMQFPFYPVAFGVGVSSFILCFVLVGDILKIIGGRFE